MNNDLIHYGIPTKSVRWVIFTKTIINNTEKRINLWKAY